MKAYFKHVSISVKDLEKEIKFYVDALGCELVAKVHMDQTKLDVARISRLPGGYAEAAFLNMPDPNGNPLQIEMLQFSKVGKEPDEPRAGWDLGWNHICVNTDDVAGLVQRCLDCGATWFSDVDGDVTGLPLVFLYDPEGHLIEIHVD